MSKLHDAIGEWANTPLADEFNKDYFKKLAFTIKQERLKYNVFPEPENVFRAYKLTPLDKVQVVVIGQD